MFGFETISLSRNVKYFSFPLFSCILLIAIPKGLSTLHVKRMRPADCCCQGGERKFTCVAVDGFSGPNLWPEVASLIVRFKAKNTKYKTDTRIIMWRGGGGGLI